MSLAKVYTTQKSAKTWTCGKCGQEIPKGSVVLHFAVGFRGHKQHRCDRPECYPKPSERESSMISAVYGAQEGFDPDACETLEDLEAEVQAVIDVCEEVADEYESNEMYDINTDLQERAELVRAAAEALANWAVGLDDEPDLDAWEEEHAEWASNEPQEGVQASWLGAGTFAEAQDIWAAEEPEEPDHDNWLADAREAARSAVDEMELP